MPGPAKSKQKSSKRKAAPPSGKKARSPKESDLSPRGIMAVVGIGASAGGLEALKHVLPELPAGKGFCYIVIQHMDPHHKSLLAELLVPATNLPVREAVDGETMRPDRIYINPPNSNLILKKGKIQLTHPLKSIGPRPSIDLFFKYLAEEYGERAVGIILSGTGSDGSNGIRSIKAAGGVTLAQAESTAKFNGMPRAAIATGSVDLILPPNEIGKALPKVMIDLDAAKKELETEDGSGLRRIFKAVYQATAVDFSDYKLPTVSRRIGRRMSVVKAGSLDEYAAYLAGHPEEAEALQKDLLISVTSFFRDRKAFEALESHLARILKSKKPGDDIRVWVPGCATGEEVYSLAIILERLLGKKRDSYRIQIFGTDLDETATGIARQGSYSEAALEGMPKELMDSYFVKEKSAYRIRAELRQKVVFARHDLTREPPFSRVDLIACRNLLIYFGAELQARVLALFHYSLIENGLLFLGNSESISRWPELFSVLDKRHKIFQRRNVDSRKFIDHARHVGLVGDLGKRKSPALPEPAGLGLPQALVKTLNLRGVILNANNNILHLVGNMDPYIRLSDGDFVNNVFNFIHRDLRQDLRSVLKKSQDKKLPMKSRTIPFESDRGTVSLTLHATPWQPLETLHGDCYLVLVLEHPSAAAPARDRNRNVKAASSEARDLQREIDALREHLGTTTEEMETSNEELQSLTEELQSSNEELQSSNEELETSNEELQSSNEELTTVNEELQVRSAELAATLSDLDALMRNLNFGLLVVDTHLRVTRFNEIVSRFMESHVLIPGEPITHIPFHFPLPRLKETLASVLRGGPSQDEIVAFQDRTLWLRITAVIGAADSISGAVLAFLDITEREKEKLALKRSEATLRAVLDSIGSGVVVVDADSKLLLANAEARVWLGKASSLKDVRNRLRLGLTHSDGGVRQEEQFPLEAALKGEALDGDAPFARHDGKHGHLEFSALPLPEGDGAVMAFRDVTERAKLERDLRRRLEFQTFVGKIAGSFLTASAEAMEEAITRSLNELADFSLVEKACLFKADVQEGIFRMTYEGGSEASPSPFLPPAEIFLGDFPYLASTLALGQPVQAVDAEAFPPLAQAERSFFSKASAFPLLFIPMIKDRQLTGFLGFLRKQGKPVPWDDEEIAVLVIAGNLFANTLDRHRLLTI